MADVAGHPSVSIFPLFLINIVFETAMQVTEMLVQTFYSSTWPCDPVLGNEIRQSGRHDVGQVARCLVRESLVDCAQDLSTLGASGRSDTVRFICEK